MRNFLGLTAAIAGGRIGELLWSRAHERRMRTRGGTIVAEPWYAAMVAVHAGTLVAAPLEVALRRTSPSRVVQMPALATLGAATALRVWTLRTLGESWTTRVTRFDDGRRRVVTGGPYRHLRHPNYLAVILELAAYPLVGGAWGTALAASA